MVNMGNPLNIFAKKPPSWMFDKALNACMCIALNALMCIDCLFDGKKDQINKTKVRQIN